MNYQINSFGSKSKEKKVSKERKCCTVHGEEVWSLWSKLYKPAGDSGLDRRGFINFWFLRRLQNGILLQRTNRLSYISKKKSCTG
jgi:hypothetical protein